MLSNTENLEAEQAQLKKLIEIQRQELFELVNFKTILPKKLSDEKRPIIQQYLDTLTYNKRKEIWSNNAGYLAACRNGTAEEQSSAMEVAEEIAYFQELEHLYSIKKAGLFDIQFKLLKSIFGTTDPDAIIVSFGGRTLQWDTDPLSCLQSYPMYAQEIDNTNKNILIINIDPAYSLTGFHLKPKANINIFNISGHCESANVLFHYLTEQLSNNKTVVLHSHLVAFNSPLSVSWVQLLFDVESARHLDDPENNNLEILSGYFTDTPFNARLLDKVSIAKEIEKQFYDYCFNIPGSCWGERPNGFPVEELKAKEDLAKKLRAIGWELCSPDAKITLEEVPSLHQAVIKRNKNKM